MKKPLKPAPLHAAQSIRGHANCANPVNAEATGPISGELATLEILAEGLDGTIARLESRLGTVLSPVPGLDEPTETANPSHSVLHGRLSVLADRLRKSMVSLDVLHDRCTL